MSPDPIYAVPSRSRPDILRDWTLTSLAASGVPNGAVHLVLDADQIDTYAQAIPGFGTYTLVTCPVEVATAGIHAKRNWLKHISGMFLFAEEDLIRPDNPCRGFKRPTPQIGTGVGL